MITSSGIIYINPNSGIILIAAKKIKKKDYLEVYNELGKVPLPIGLMVLFRGFQKGLPFVQGVPKQADIFKSLI